MGSSLQVVVGKGTECGCSMMTRKIESHPLGCGCSRRWPFAANALQRIKGTE